MSNEFRELREKLRQSLSRAGCKVEVQDEFRQTPEDTIEKLDEYIRTCDAVIHIVGSQSGSIANGQAVEDYVSAVPNFLQADDDQQKRLADLRADLADFSELTYTQWEAFIARHHKIPLFVYRLSNSTTDESQTRHLGRLEQLRRYAEDFADEADLFSKLVGDLKEIVPELMPPRKIASSRILRHSPDRLFGRETEIAALDGAWASSDTINVYSLIAWGGVGKTSLVAHWVKRLERAGWPEVERYFDWSFYSQGTGESRQTSSDQFIDAALRFFDDPDPTVGGPWERGQRLANLINQYRTLLVLDGIEPLQYPPTDRSGQAGRLKDQGLQALLAGLAVDNPGLCVVTSRETLTDLQTYRDTTAPQPKLEKLMKDAAISLLRHLQVVGTDEEMAAAWQELRGHALSLQLLGRYIVDAFPDKDIRHRPEITYEEADEERQGRSAFKVMAAYERWLAGLSPFAPRNDVATGTADSTNEPAPKVNSSSIRHQRELGILRLTGLFDRPIIDDCLAALRKEPAIPGLTEGLVGLTDRQWNVAIKRLTDIDLISVSEADDGTLLDAHPLIREYFAMQLREQQIGAFRAGHSRLFDHLCDATEYRPDGIDGLQPLYQAVVHGCMAGRQQETRADVYRDRILRGTGADGFYSSKKLGAIGADLSAVAAFFDQPWSQLSTGLNESDQAWLLNEAASCLQSLGRLTEAVDPMRLSGEMDVEKKKWKGAAISYSNLSELQLRLGHVSKAVSDGHRSIEFAERSKDPRWKKCTRTTAADALHQFGLESGFSCQEGLQSIAAYGNQRSIDQPLDDSFVSARALFTEAERMQQNQQPQFPLLYSLSGFRYCDLLLAPAECTAWRVLLDVASGRHVPRADTTKVPATRPELRGTDRLASGASDKAIQQTPGYMDNSEHLAASTHPAERDGELDAIDEVEDQATKTLEWAIQYLPLLDIALDHLTLARVALYRAILTADPADLSSQRLPLPGALSLIAAVNGLRQAGQFDEIPKGLITAAIWYQLTGDSDAAIRDLNEAHQIAIRGPMPLYLADILLTRARLFGNPVAVASSRRDEGVLTVAGSHRHDYPWPYSSPEQDLAEARRVIEECHYHRRLEELEDAEAALLADSSRKQDDKTG